MSRHEALEAFLNEVAEVKGVEDIRIVHGEYDPEGFSAVERALQQGALNATRLTCELLPIPAKFEC